MCPGVGVGLTFGLVVLAMIYSLGDVSGAHLNPAVTLGFWAARRLDLRSVAPYILSQCLGALVASGILYMLFPSHPTLGATRPSGSLAQSFVLEVILTWILMFVILNMSTGARGEGNYGWDRDWFRHCFRGNLCRSDIRSVDEPRAITGPGLDVRANRCPVALFCGAGDGRSTGRADLPVRARGRVLRRGGPRVTDSDPPGQSASSLFVLRIPIEVRWRKRSRAFMAAAGIEARSAGSRPSGRVNPRAIRSMLEVGYDLSLHQSNSIRAVPDVEYDFVVTMGCGDECPFIRARNRADWDIPDPKDMDPGEFGKVRDLIERKVKAMLASL